MLTPRDIVWLSRLRNPSCKPPLCIFCQPQRQCMHECTWLVIMPSCKQILPKKSEVQVAKCEGKVNVIMVEDEPLFYNGGSPSLLPRAHTHTILYMNCRMRLVLLWIPNNCSCASIHAIHSCVAVNSSSILDAKFFDDVCVC